MVWGIRRWMKIEGDLVSNADIESIRKLHRKIIEPSVQPCHALLIIPIILTKRAVYNNEPTPTAMHITYS